MSRTLYLHRLRRLLQDEGPAFRAALSQQRGWKPREVEVRLTWACDAHCVMCGLHAYRSIAGTGYTHSLPRKRLMEVLGEIVSLGGESVLFSGGEVTILSDLPDIVHDATMLGLKVHINTHGGHLTPLLCDQLIEAGLTGVMVSLDAPNADTHDAIRGVPGLFDRAVAGVRYIRQRASTVPDFHLLINTVIMSLNYRLLPEMVKLVDNLGVREINFSPLSIDNPWDDWATGAVNLKLTEDAESVLEREVFPEVISIATAANIRAALPARMRSDGSPQVFKCFFNEKPVICAVAHYHAVINVNGDVIPCCYASSRSNCMGNVRHQSFYTIWNGDKYAQFRRGCFPADYDMCRSCSQHRNENELIEKWYCRSSRSIEG